MWTFKLLKCQFNIRRTSSDAEEAKELIETNYNDVSKNLLRNTDMREKWPGERKY